MRMRQLLKNVGLALFVLLGLAIGVGYFFGVNLLELAIGWIWSLAAPGRAT